MCQRFSPRAATHIQYTQKRTPSPCGPTYSSGESTPQRAPGCKCRAWLTCAAGTVITRFAGRPPQGRTLPNGQQIALMSWLMHLAAIAVANSTTPASHICVLHGMTKHSTQIRAMHRSRLFEISHKLYLFSFLLAKDGLMLGHWLRHYHQLGVLPMHTSIAVRLEPGESEAAMHDVMHALHQAGVPLSHVRVLSAPPSDTLKVRTINEAIASLPSDSWFIYADVDEHFVYPCWIAPKRCMLGVMVDQLANDGNISVATEVPSLADQYPLQCRIRKYLQPKSNYLKTILFSVRQGATGKLRAFRNTHNLANSSCTLLGVVRHYSMTGQQMDGNVLRTRETRGDTHKGGEAAARNYANATCGITDKRTGACKDYQLIGNFMRSQVDAIAKGGDALAVTSHLCRGNLSQVFRNSPTLEEVANASNAAQPERRPPNTRAHDCCVGFITVAHARLRKCNGLKRQDCSALKDETSCHNSRVGPQPCVWVHSEHGSCTRGLHLNESGASSHGLDRPRCPHDGNIPPSDDAAPSLLSDSFNLQKELQKMHDEIDRLKDELREKHKTGHESRAIE